MGGWHLAGKERFLKLGSYCWKSNWYEVRYILLTSLVRSSSVWSQSDILTGNGFHIVIICKTISKLSCRTSQTGFPWKWTCLGTTEFNMNSKKQFGQGGLSKRKKEKRSWSRHFPKPFAIFARSCLQKYTGTIVFELLTLRRKKANACDITKTSDHVQAFSHQWGKNNISHMSAFLSPPRAVCMGKEHYQDTN